jgi:hypothetical protein
MLIITPPWTGAGGGTVGATGVSNFVQVSAANPITISQSTTRPAVVVSCDITTYGGPVQITCYGEAVSNSTGMWCTLQLYRSDGITNTALGSLTTVEGIAASENQQFSLSVIDKPPASRQYTYSLRLVGIAPGVSVTFGENGNPTIYALELQNVIGARGLMGYTGSTGVSGVGGSTGASGHVGATGASGISGTVGASGPTGYTGATGVSGVGGSTGASGYNGATGASGYLGATGASGLVGATGPTGFGATGASGYIGATGASGIGGATGASGLAGATGSSGVIGLSGATGASGYIGATGASGPSGYTGATGASGLVGNDGATGASGVTGATGASGVTGATGATGPSGYIGATGTVAVVAGAKSTFWVAASNQTHYYSIKGYNGTDPDGYVVSVGALDQIPVENYSILPDNEGTLKLVTAPPAGAKVSIRSVLSYGAVNDLLPAAAKEIAVVKDSEAPATINYNVLEQQVLVYQREAVSGYSLNIRGSSIVPLNDVLGVGQSISLTLLVKQPTTGLLAYDLTEVDIDTSQVLVMWLGSTVPEKSLINSYTSYNFSILKTAENAYLIFGSVASFL